MKKNNLFIILSHCDSGEKLSVLISTISRIKKEGFEILLVSHIPLSSEIQSLVDYFVYDKSNPLLIWPERGMCHWKSLWWDGGRYRLDSIFPDTGWTALNQFKLGSSLGLGLDYDYYTFINYDTSLTSSLIEVANNPKDLYLTRVVNYNDWEGEKKITRKTLFPGMLFNIFPKEILQSVIPLISREKYINGIGASNWHELDFNVEGTKNNYSNSMDGITFNDAEQYLYSIISNFEYVVHPEAVEEKCIFEIEGGIKNFNFNTYNEEFKINCDNGERISHPYKINTYHVVSANKVKNIVIYDLKKNLKIKFNDNIIEIDKTKVDKDGHQVKYLINGLNGVENIDIKNLGFYDKNNLYVDLLPNMERVKNSPVIRTIMEWDDNEI